MAGSPNCKRSSRSILLKVAAVGITASVFFAFATGALAETAQGAESRTLVNQARAQAGLGSLEAHPGLEAIAQAQADRMAARDAIYHNPNLKSDADAAGVNWELIGENVGVGPSVADVHQAFMNSPGHRENIVYPDYNAIGVGIAAAKDGSVFVAHAYAKVAAPAPAPAATRPQNTSPATASQPVVADTNSTVPAVNDAAPATSATPEKTDAPAVNAVVGGIVNTAPVF
jgi:hypothetical protein